MSASDPDFVYKIVSGAAFEAARGADAFPVMPIDLKDGFVHFSTAAQLAETLKLHFAGQSGLVVFAVATAALGKALRWEASRGGQLFPHGYGALSPALVGERATVSVGADGAVRLPDFVK
jgi:uncharacterized protein (DUF952 family)